jgi:hypothetical protein
MNYTHAASADHRIVADALGVMFDPKQGWLAITFAEYKANLMFSPATARRPDYGEKDLLSKEDLDGSRHSLQLLGLRPL